MANVPNSTLGSEKPVSNMQIFGEMSWLLTKSTLHRSMPIWKLEQWLLPPIALRQYRLYRREARPTALFTYAYLSPDVEERYIKSPQALQPSDWKSGDRLWVIDFVVPFGDMALVKHDFRCNVFPNTSGRSLRARAGTERLIVQRFHGKRIAGQTQ